MIFFKKLSLALKIFLLAALMSNCSEDSNLVADQKLENFTFKLLSKNGNLNYRAKIKESGHLYFVLQIKNFSKSNIFEMDIDVTSQGYKLVVSDILEQKALSWANTIDNETVKIASVEIENFINQHEEVTDFQLIESQGLFFCRAIFNAINRYQTTTRVSSFSKTNQNTLSITTYEGYITDLTPYVAKEDIIISTSNLENYFSTYSNSRLNSEDIQYINRSLEGYQSVSLIEYENLVHEPIDQLGDCVLLCGGDCGCCGNYEGQCYYAHVMCYIHDFLCESCEPSWFCFSGCKPTPC